MITFWLPALVLLVSAMLLLLWPILKVRKHQAEEDRTALNVALYQERLDELQAQLEQGTLSRELFEEGRLEAERELLEDTAQGVPQQKANLGMTLPLIASLLLPVAGAGLYMVWGSSDLVKETLGQMPLIEERQAVEDLMRRMPTIQEPEARDAAMTDLVRRLENIVSMQPDAPDVWYFLGRSYMNEQRHKDAAHAFERAMDTAGRQPEILTEWVQAKFFAEDSQWSGKLQEAIEIVLEADPNDASTLGFVGIAAFETGNFNVAHAAWSRLLSGMDPRSPSAQAVLTGIERAEQAMAEHGEINPAAVEGPILPDMPDQQALSQSGQVRLKVRLSDELAGTIEPSAAVFVFARSPESGQLPLAAQRLDVAELPAEVLLSDADAVMGEYQLSSASSIQVQASIALDGNASAPQWVSASMDAEADSGEALELVIDRTTPVQD